MIAEVSASGTITSSRNYDVYGNVRSGVNANGTSAHKFVGNLGHPSDNNTGLIYMQARYMDPATGRFVSEDPKLQGGNWFLYCDNNPVTRYDSTGRDWVDDVVNFFVRYMLGQFCSRNGLSGVLTGTDLTKANFMAMAKFGLQAIRSWMTRIWGSLFDRGADTLEVEVAVDEKVTAEIAIDAIEGGAELAANGNQVDAEI